MAAAWRKHAPGRGGVRQPHAAGFDRAAGGPVQLRDQQRGGGGDQRHDADHTETPGYEANLATTQPGNPRKQNHLKNSE